MDKVKRFKSGFITDPKVLTVQNTVKDVDAIKQKYGFSGVPITADGKIGSRLLGIITNRDVDFLEDRTLSCGDVMTKEKDLIVAKESCTLAEANLILRNSKKAKLPIVNAKHELIGLLSRTYVVPAVPALGHCRVGCLADSCFLCRVLMRSPPCSDLLKNRAYPYASKDKKGRLLVGAAVGTR